MNALRADAFSEGDADSSASSGVSPRHHVSQMRRGSESNVGRKSALSPPPLFVSNGTEQPIESLHSGSAPTGMHPLAVFATSSEMRSPRALFAQAAVEPNTATPPKKGNRFVQSLKRLTLKQNGSESTSTPTTPRSARERSATIDSSEFLAHFAQSPPRAAAAAQESFDRPRVSATVASEPDEVARVFAALRTATSTGNVLADSNGTANDSNDTSSTSTSSVDDHERFAKAVAGGTTACGASVIFELDDTSGEERKAPIARVRSTSSVADLRKRLVAEGTVSGTLSSSSSAGSSSSGNATTSSTNSAGNASGSTSPTMRRLIGDRDYTLKAKKLRSFTLIDYNPDPLALSPWRTFLIPNKVITHTMRLCLKRAHHSDHLADPYRLCQCTTDCVDHATPDAIAKLSAILMLDPKFALSSPCLRRVARHLNEGHNGVQRGAWAVYRVPEPENIDNGAELEMLTNFETTPITHRYRFKVFV